MTRQTKRVANGRWQISQLLPDRQLNLAFLCLEQLIRVSASTTFGRSLKTFRP